jgi:UPF0755 protein
MGSEKSVFSKFLKIATLVVIILGAIGGFLFYKVCYSPNVNLNGKEIDYLYIKTGSSYADVLQMLIEKNMLINEQTFEFIANRKNYPNKVSPGRYKLTKGMNNISLVDLLRSGKQEPINVTFNSVRTKEQLASLIGSKLEVDSVAFLEMLNDSAFLDSLGFNKNTIICMFIPNTYEFFWTTNARTFIKRMNREYLSFWNEDKLAKAKYIGLSPVQVSTLASIVQEETQMAEDRPVVAGVYINRLKKNMPLEADPTLKFAKGDFTIKRILNEDKKIDSPYNTYMYSGLPPGPINLPSADYINAVLNYTEHDYLFFCAREDLMGYSNFAKTYQEHLINARKYQAELNRRNIKR